MPVNSLWEIWFMVLNSLLAFMPYGQKKNSIADLVQKYLYKRLIKTLVIAHRAFISIEK